MEIEITPAAQERLLAVAQLEGIDLQKDLLRIAVLPGGCSGLTYDLGWDSVTKEDDHVFTVGEIRVIIDPVSFLHMEGTQLDFTGGLEGKGFHFFNPVATRSCACGESFGV